MSLVSNFIGGISPKQFSEKSLNSTQMLDSNGMSFPELLEKQMDTSNLQENNWLSLMGVKLPEETSGINIQDLVISSKNLIKDDIAKISSENDITSSEMITFMQSALDTHNFHDNTNFLNFAQKKASNFYNKCASNVVTDLSEFVEDALKKF